MLKFRPTLAAAAVALACSAGSASAQFSNYYFFGDSSTDAGAFGARFTVNPGLVWAQSLGARYGAVVTTSVNGGTDYAQGGARVTQSPGYPPAPPTGTALTLSQQIDQQLAKTPTLDSHALYGVSIGYNDLFTAIDATLTAQITPAQAQAAIAQAAVQAGQQVARLQAAGAKYVVVLNLYDTGKSPDGLPYASLGTPLTNLYNSTLAATLSQAGLHVISVDTNKLFNEMIANPTAFGFTNVTQPACTTSSALFCTPSTLVAPNAAQNYLFSDGTHPTPFAHAIMAQVVASMIEGPVQMSALAEAPIGVEQALYRTLDGRMISGINSSRPMSKLEAWAAYDYGTNDIAGQFLSGNANLNTVAAGGDIKFSEKLIVGGMFGYTENKGDFGNSAGTFKLTETSGTLYAGYGDGPWYIGATLGTGYLDYGTIQRTIQLGALTRTENGVTSGWHIMGSVLGGYWFQPSPDFQHGPFARAAFQEIQVDGFNEQSSDSTALSYGPQKRRSVITSLGWQATGRIGMVRPFARVTWEYESQNDERTVTATPVGSNISYSVTGIKPDNNYVHYVIGAAADFGGITGFITGAGTNSKSDGNGYGVTVGVRIPM